MQRRVDEKRLKRAYARRTNIKKGRAKARERKEYEEELTEQARLIETLERHAANWLLFTDPQRLQQEAAAAKRCRDAQAAVPCINCRKPWDQCPCDDRNVH
jgi:hypothetical protein